MRTILFLLFLMFSITSFGQENEIFIPNAFSSNGDGNNDYFKIVYEGEFDIYEFQVFNRYGSMIFTTNNPNESWSGGETFFAGNHIFVYKLTYRFKDRKDTKIRYGTITQIR